MAAIGQARFEPHFAWDRYALPIFVALAWLGIIMGFVPEVAGKLEKHQFVFPLAVHFHAAVFVSWLVLFTTQVTLVRTGNVALHRKLGIVGVVLAGCVVVMGLVVSYVVDHAKFGTPEGDAPFLSIQLFDIVNFFCLASAGLLLRRDSAAHKRLMLLATFSIVDAGFGRWWGPGLEGALGKGFFGEWMALYLGDILLIVGLGFYDLSTRKRLHPVYATGATFALSMQALAAYLYVTPWWKPIATRLIGH
jgi:hypothetical protein